MNLTEAKKSKHFMIFLESLDALNNIAPKLKEIQKYYNQFLEGKDKVPTKSDSDFTEYRTKENSNYQVLLKDREHPLDRVMLNEFNADTNSDLEDTKIIYGSDANNITRMFHALAITLGNKIYFRDGSYKPETEEGRKLIAHELTHVAQNKDKPLADNRTRNELEKEAEKSEKTQEIDTNIYLKRIIKNQEYILKQEEWKKIDKMALELLEKDIETNADNLNEYDYLDLLNKYTNWYTSGIKKWQIK